MQTARELYPDLVKEEEESDKEWYSFWAPSDYSPIISSIGEVLVEVEAGSYQGDTFVLFKRDDQYGLLTLGWGSCSGCDALQACDSFEEVDDLILQIHNQARWFDTAEEVIKYVYSNIDEWSYYEEEWAEFQDKIKEVLNEQACNVGSRS